MKRKLFWVLYFFMATLCATLFLILFREHENFNLMSLFLIIMLPILVYLMWITSPFAKVEENYQNGWRRFQTKIFHLRYEKQLKFYEDDPEKQENVSKSLIKESCLVLHLGLLLICPAVFVCIFLFSYIVKIVVLGVPFVLLTYCVWLIDLIKLRKLNKQRLENEKKKRIEQERREELGKWN